MKLTNPGKLLASLLLGVLVTSESGKAIAQPKLPTGARLRLGTLDLRHMSQVSLVRFSVDGKTLLSASDNDIVRWDLKTGKEQRRFDLQQLRAISADGKTLALGREDISLVDAVTGLELLRWKNDKYRILNAVFSADGTTLITGCDDRTIRFWETSSGKQIRLIKTNHIDELKAVGLSPDGKTCFSLGGHLDRSLQLWDVATGKPTHKFSNIETAIFSLDSRAVIVGQGGELILLETASGKVAKRFIGSGQGITALAVTPHGNQVAVAGQNDIIRILDLTTGKRVQWLPWDSGAAVSLAFSADGKTLAAGGWPNAVRLWEWQTGRELFANGHQGAVGILAFSLDGKTLTSLGGDQSIRLWSLPNGKQKRCWSDRQPENTAEAIFGGIGCCPDGKSVVLGSWDKYYRVIDLHTGKERRFKNSHFDSAPEAISRDGQRMLTIPANVGDLTEGLACTLWDLEQGKPLRRFVHSVKTDPQDPKDRLVGRITAAAFAPDGKTFATIWGFYRSESTFFPPPLPCGIGLWDIATGKERRIVAQVSTLAFLDNGKTLVGAGTDRNQGVLQFWDVATLKLLRQFKGPLEWTKVLAFSPDGKLFASTGGGDDPAVYLWQTTTGKQIQRFVGHRSEILCLAFSPDSRMLASGSNDTTILLWEVLSYR